MRRLPTLAVLAAAVVACGSRDEPPPAGCAAKAAVVERAVLRAPAAVTLPGGARLSECVSQAQTDGQLQDVGFLLTGVAHRLARRATRDPRAATALGYLVGAARRGAAGAEGIPAELIRRIERTAAPVQRTGGTAAMALRAGLVAGERSG
jgi:hypothetical protein